MIIASIISLLCGFLIWFAELLPQYHLFEVGSLFDSVSQVWEQAYSWSGVIPIGTILNIFQTALAMLTVFIVYSTFMLVINLIRGSGA
ncbi:hypothetical protein DesyoDRAFT_1282 [Desulfosporosinus youngiae DSM 17734]|uniref:Uncharacterized protein n=1 Tax=Desulfosporosinus youngiae DSM 17734 TaxID=768710 RepID=H5Y2A0_9FIRM|nr:hypothetical protein DesyoDRAFT_1282 [Desulfosporosinus youngiae DSM 17734]